ncbi:hypothetical protein JW710_01090 [Candidatus Dojkabacteria bacterium]|nr:hypothetical protein [Candidatus Dojkabacteria bacterium]
MKRYRKSVLFLVLCVISVVSPLLGTAFAQESSDRGITVSPVKYEFSGEPGEVLEGTVKYYNSTGSEKDLYLKAFNFEPLGETGFPGFSNDLYPDNASLKDWIVLETSHIVVEHITEERAHPTIVNFTVHIPEDAAPGGHYAGIIQRLKPFDQVDELEGSGLVISPESACLIILNVEGAVTREGYSEQFFVADPYAAEKKPVKLFEYPPVEFIARVRNSGNTHFKPQGNVFLYRGDKKIADFKVNEDEGNVLRESIRRFEVDTWGTDEAFITRVAVKDDDGEPVLDDEGNVKTKIKINWDKLSHIPIGKYEAKLALVYDGEEGKELIQDSVTFWIIPWKIILIILLIIIIYISIVIDRNRRKKNKGKKKDKK